MTVRVALVDDHEVVRRGLRDLLDGEPGIEVVAEAGGVQEALARVAATSPDVVVVDVRLPDGDGVSLCRALRQLDPAPRCLVLTAFDDERALVEAIMAGASGYLLKQVRGQDLVDAVREVAAGRSLLDPVTTAHVLDRMRESAKTDELAGLTERERAVLELMGEGMTNRQIAERLFLAEKTVKNYVTSVLAKLGMERRTQAVAWIARRPQRD
jgi:two-component system, NarL family, response regulator DevR